MEFEITPNLKDDVDSPQSHELETNTESEEYQQEEWLYNIAINRPRGQIYAPKKYGFESMMACAFQAVEEVESREPSTY